MGCVCVCVFVWLVLEFFFYSCGLFSVRRVRQLVRKPERLLMGQKQKGVRSLYRAEAVWPIRLALALGRS